MRPPGHDIALGAELVREGTQLGPFDLAWLAACGLQTIAVRRRIRLALFSTGDELRSAGDTLRPGQIYDSNRFVLRQLLRGAPVEIEDLGILPDDPAAHRSRRCVRPPPQHDVVMTSGGVSVGDADYVRDIVERLGRIEFWKIAIKPGKPLAYGRIGELSLLRLTRQSGLDDRHVPDAGQTRSRDAVGHTSPTPPLRVAATLSCRHRARTRSRRIPARRPTRIDAQRRLCVQPTSDQSSNRIGSFRGANCLIEVPRTSGNLARGEFAVEILPFAGLLRLTHRRLRRQK